MTAHDPNFSLSPAVLLDRIANELGQAGDLLSNIELVVASLLQTGHSTGPGQQLDAASSHALQDLDLIRQVVGDLQTCLRQITSTENIRCAGFLESEKMIATLQLADLRSRLGNCESETVSPQKVEIF